MDDELEPKDDLESKKDPIDMETEVGLSRREMLRRSAIVGGALVWSVPAIQSIGMKAAAAQVAVPSPGACASCYCFSLRHNGRVRKEFGFTDGMHAAGLMNANDCEDYCKHQGAYVGSNGGGAPNGPYQHGSYCSGTGKCTVTTGQVGSIPVSPNPVCT